jgi:hypothetical protein
MPGKLNNNVRLPSTNAAHRIIEDRTRDPIFLEYRRGYPVLLLLS